MHCREGYGLRVSLLAGIFMLAVATTQAFGQTCIQDAYNSFNGLTAHPKTLSCTANDVRVSKVTGVSVIDTTTHTIIPGNKCISGTTFSFIADFTIQTTANATRSNIGIFFGTGSANIANNQALTGQCSNAILTPQYQPYGTYTLGDANYEELDTNGETAPNACGDTSSADNFGLGLGVQDAELEVDNVYCPLTALDPCPDPTITGTCMALPECTGWYQPTANVPICNSTTHQWVSAAVPGTTSKCNCTTLYIPVQLVRPSISVAKSCNTALTTGVDKISCDAGPEGSEVTYHVKINNTTPASEGGIVVDQICDDRYGSIYDDGVITTACPAGTLAGLFTFGTSLNPCNAATLGDIANGGSATCDFVVSHGENLDVTDHVTVRGHSDVSTDRFFEPKDSNDVTVTSSDAPSTATTAKGLDPGPQYACVTLRYNVTVTNTSGYDEVLTLNQVSSPTYTPALHDSYFGDITYNRTLAPKGSNVAGSVTGTTCGVDTTADGLGTLSDQKGGGTFPKTLAVSGGSYTCKFDGVVCGTPGPIPSGEPNPGSICTLGLSNVDTVTATLTDDESDPNVTITQDAQQFTANVCLKQQ